MTVIGADLYLNVLNAGDYRCGFCGDPLDDKTADVAMLHPRSLGGKVALKNLVSCCKDCQKQKGHMSLKQFRSFVFDSVAEKLDKTFDALDKVSRLIDPSDREILEGTLVSAKIVCANGSSGRSVIFFFERDGRPEVQAELKQ